MYGNQSVMMTPQQEHLLAAGRLVEAGWVGWSATLDPGVSPQELFNLRMAFFCGAHHVYANIREAAKRHAVFDMAAMDRELAEFIKEYSLYQLPVSGSA